MESRIKTYTYADGTRQRIQWVTLPDWEHLDFLSLTGSENDLDCFASIFRQYLIPACPWLFGSLVLFALPQGLSVPFPRETRHGTVASELTAAAAGLQKGAFISGGKLRFRDPETEAFWTRLEKQDCLRIVSGKLPITQFIPVGRGPGRLSEAQPDARMKVNASFFIMDPFDCATVYDHVGACLGLMVKDGVITNPPLYGREALLVRQGGRVSVEPLDIRDLPIAIGGRVYRHGRNCRIHTRPQSPLVMGSGTKLIIVGCRVEGVCQGIAPVPASGYVLSLPGDCPVKPGDRVAYPALEDVVFGIQVGNSILKKGVKTEAFLSKFYHIRRLQPVPYPPSLYPMNFEKSRAARIALGANGEGRPVILWAEGAPKLGYVPGKHSRGASLKDMGTYCADAGMVEAVNLDGGGSAQLLVENRRQLEISDRKEDHSQSERLVPNGLILK